LDPRTGVRVNPAGKLEELAMTLCDIEVKQDLVVREAVPEEAHLRCDGGHLPSRRGSVIEKGSVEASVPKRLMPPKKQGIPKSE
jgi:hypothetical protein